MFVMATLLFTLASLLCGMAPSFEALVAARVLQGMVGASMIPLSQTLLTTIYPPQKRGLALGLWSMTTVLAPVVAAISRWLADGKPELALGIPDQFAGRHHRGNAG